jgi:uncharacterized membrane protein YfcA
MVLILKAVLGLLTSFFAFYYVRDVNRNREKFSNKPWPPFLATGFISNFFDTLGVGSFAQQAAVFKFFKLVDDRLIPGTMNVGNTLPTVTQAFIFMTAVEVDALTLISMSLAAPVGAVFGAGFVAKMSKRKIQVGLGTALMAVALIILAGLLKLMPSGGEAIGLSGWQLVIAIVMCVIFGALQTIGVGFYAPCMAMVYTFGMHPATAFPIMMTATGMLMAAGGARFVKENAYDRKAAISLTIAGMVGVFIAAFIVKSLPLEVLKWLVLGVVVYTSISMFISAGKKEMPAAIGNQTL